MTGKSYWSKTLILQKNTFLHKEEICTMEKEMTSKNLHRLHVIILSHLSSNEDQQMRETIQL